MRSWKSSYLIAATFAILWGTGFVFHVYGWFDQNIGGWFVPVVLGICGLVLVAVPFIRGVREGMDEAEESRAA